VTREFGDLSFQLTQCQHRLLAPTGFVHDRLSMAVYPYSILLENRKRRANKQPASRPLTAGAQVPIAAVYPLEGAAQAQRRVEAGHVLGKVVLQVSPAPL
jgi:Zinc-binding dehydrogenase